MTLARSSVVATLLLAGAAAEAWFPFSPDMPFMQRSGPTRQMDVVSFDGSDALVGEPGAAWVHDAIATGEVTVRLQARTTDREQWGPARLLALSEDTMSGSFVIGQQGNDLIVRAGRPDARASEISEHRVADVFNDDRWHDVVVTLTGEAVRVDVDDVPIVELPGAAGAIGWDPGHRLALGDEWTGRRAWQGELRRVRVETPGRGVDLLAPGSLREVDDVVVDARVGRVGDLLPHDPVATTVLRLAGWFAVGAAAAAAWAPRRLAVVIVGAAPWLLTAGKFFVARRDPVLADAVVGTLGVALGWRVRASANRRAARLRRMRRRLRGPVSASV